MNRQEAFNITAQALLKQGSPGFEPNSESGEACVYIASNGARCAIGHLLSEEDVRRFERFNEVPLFDLEYEMLPKMLQDDFKFFLSLQKAHDQSAAMSFIDDLRDADWIKLFKYQMQFVARRYNLNPEVLEST